MLTVKYECVTPALVKEHYHVKKKFIYSISEIRDAYFLHRENQVAKSVITKSTLEVNENYARHIMDFAKSKNVVNPMDIPETFLSDLFDWMIDDDRSGERFARKVAIFCKHMLKWGKKKNLCPSLSIFDVDMPGKADSDDDLDTTHLNIFQLDRLLKFDFNLLVQAGQIMKSTADTLNEERNAFVFNCFTGMHHCDYQDKKFYLEPYGDALFLKGCRRKTKKPFAIKLLSPAERIIELYDNDLLKLPIKTNQKRNQTLKLVAMYVGIPLVLTTKIARKTFTDLALNEMMMTADDVAACLGLSSTKFLKNYGRIREKRLVKVMKSWKRLNKINKMNKAS